MNWIKKVEEARSVEAVLEAVNDYLLELPDEHWHWIPRNVRPTLLASEEELHRWHQDLVQELTRTSSPNIRLQDICVLFVRASVRVHQINLKDNRDSNANDRDFSAAPRRGSKHRQV